MYFIKFASWEVDLVGVDHVEVDFIGVDLMVGYLFNFVGKPASTIIL